MAKGLESKYEAGRRGGAWFKIKRANTLDLVVLGAEWGHGRRKGKLSNLHLAARDPVWDGEGWGCDRVACPVVSCYRALAVETAGWLSPSETQTLGSACD